MSTVKQDTIELIYKAFQENPTRLSYSTEKLKKQFNASQEEVQKARLYYRLNSLDFIVAQAMEKGDIRD
jgi:site-specific DNA-adenine methylase